MYHAFSLSSLSRPFRSSSRHLNDASYRETYMCSHSVTLVTIALHALAQLDWTTAAEIQGTVCHGLQYCTALCTVSSLDALPSLYSSFRRQGNSTVCIELGKWKARHPAAAPRVPRTYQRKRTCAGSALPSSLLSTPSTLPLVVLPDGLSAVADAIRNLNGEELGERCSKRSSKMWKTWVRIVCGDGKSSAKRWKGAWGWGMAEGRGQGRVVGAFHVMRHQQIASPGSLYLLYPFNNIHHQYHDLPRGATRV
ncbi:hypothetical protein BJV78DRAFT_531254 [Lactifluus subvellereus]|nr:hypothetical protein BJV78DRAFT_531254 [Lactifluus subvellereus]